MTHYLQHQNEFTNPDIANTYDETSLWASRFGLLLLDNLAMRGDMRVLDVACGTGFPLFELAHTLGQSCHLTGLDNWPHALERARLKLRTYADSNVDLVQADAAHMPFPDGRFDLITCNLGINNFEDPPAVMSECYRVAKPACRAVFTSNIKGHMGEFYSIFRRTLEAQGRTGYLPRLEANESHRGTKESLLGLLENAGFKVGKVVENSFRMRYLDGAAFFNHWLTRLGFLDGWRAVVEPEDEQELFAALEREINSIAAREGEFAVTVPMLYLEGIKEVRSSAAPA